MIGINRDKNHYTKTKKLGFKNLENKSIFDFDVIQLCESYACKK